MALLKMASVPLLMVLATPRPAFPQDLPRRLGPDMGPARMSCWCLLLPDSCAGHPGAGTPGETDPSSAGPGLAWPLTGRWAQSRAACKRPCLPRDTRGALGAELLPGTARRGPRTAPVPSAQTSHMELALPTPHPGVGQHTPSRWCL